MRHAVPFLVISLLFSGCSTLSKKECQQGDWYGIGLSDGAKGYTLARLENHRKSCSKHDQSINHAAYQKGRSEGLKQFCTRASGYKRGSDGRDYQDVCPAPTKREFLRGYVSGLDNALDRAKHSLRQARWDYKREQQASHDLKGEENRKKTKKQLDRLNSEVERRDRELESLQKLIDKAEYLMHQLT